MQFGVMYFLSTINTQIPPDQIRTILFLNIHDFMLYDACFPILLDSANSMLDPPVIAHTEFYNETLDNVDLFREYSNWQDPAQQLNGFSFCQYPFLLTISAKRFILQKDSETQMISQARVR